MRAVLVLVSLVALLVGACSGSGNDRATDTVGLDRAASTPEAPDAPEAPDVTAEPGPDTEAEAAVAVVRAWSAALNAGENEVAAELFAPNAIVIQGATTLALPDMDTAVRFNASLPCSGLIVDVRVNGQVVTAVFELGHRLQSRCDAPPGTLAAADFLIEDGSILAWELVPVPDRGNGANSAV